MRKGFKVLRFKGLRVLQNYMDTKNLGVTIKPLNLETCLPAGRLLNVTNFVIQSL